MSPFRRHSCQFDLRSHSQSRTVTLVRASSHLWSTAGRFNTEIKRIKLLDYYACIICIPNIILHRYYNYWCKWLSTRKKSVKVTVIVASQKDAPFVLHIGPTSGGGQQWCHARESLCDPAAQSQFCILSVKKEGGSLEAGKDFLLWNTHPLTICC